MSVTYISENNAVIQDDWTRRKVMGPLPLRAAQVYSQVKQPSNQLYLPDPVKWESSSLILNIKTFASGRHRRR